jgi:hypothetical protein
MGALFVSRDGVNPGGHEQAFGEGVGEVDEAGAVVVCVLVGEADRVGDGAACGEGIGLAGVGGAAADDAPRSRGRSVPMTPKM